MSSFFTDKQMKEIEETAAKRRLKRKNIRYGKKVETQKSKRDKFLSDKVVELTKSEDIEGYVNHDKKLTLSKESIITLYAGGFKVGEIARAMKVSHSYVSKVINEVDVVTLNNRRRKKSVYESFDHIVSCVTDKDKDERFKGSDMAGMIKVAMDRYEPTNKIETTIHIDLESKLNEARKRIEAENVIEAEIISPPLLEANNPIVKNDDPS